MSGSFLERFGNRTQTTSLEEQTSGQTEPPAPIPALVHEPEETLAYAAFQLSKSGDRQARLKIIYPNGMVGIYAYTYITEVISTSHQHLSIIYTHCVINLRGRHLTLLMDLILDEKIRVLRPYREREGGGLDEGQPVIHDIVRESYDDAVIGQEPPAQAA